MSSPLLKVPWTEASVSAAVGNASSARATGGAVLALRIVVQHQHYQPRAVAGLRPLQHLAIAAGVAERRLRPLADGQIDALGLAGVIVDEKDLRLAHQHGLAVLDFVLGGDARSHH